MPTTPCARCGAPLAAGEFQFDPVCAACAGRAAASKPNAPAISSSGYGKWVVILLAMIGTGMGGAWVYSYKEKQRHRHADVMTDFIRMREDFNDTFKKCEKSDDPLKKWWVKENRDFLWKINAAVPSLDSSKDDEFDKMSMECHRRIRESY